MRTEAFPPAWSARPAMMLMALMFLPPRAQGNPPEVAWEDLARLANDHPHVAAARLEALAAQAAIDAAGAAPNPTLSGTLSYGESRDIDLSRVEWDLALNVPLGWIAQRGPRREAARARADVAQAEALARQREVILQLVLLYWGLAHEQERVQALEELNRETTELARTVEQRVSQGEARPVEATLMTMEAGRVAGELQGARWALRAKAGQMALLLGLTEAPIAKARFSSLPKSPPLDRVLDRVRQAHPELRAAKQRVRALRADLEKERRARIPALAVEVFTTHELDRRAYGAGLEVELPLWNWNSGAIAEAQRHVEAGQREVYGVALDIESAVLEAQAACQAGEELAARYRSQILPLAQDAAAVVERTYELGETSIQDVLAARRDLLETRRLYLATLAQAHIDCSRLAVVVGEDRP